MSVRMPTLVRRRSAALLSALAVIVALLAFSDSAQAGYYDVAACQYAADGGSRNSWGVYTSGNIGNGYAGPEAWCPGGLFLGAAGTAAMQNGAAFGLNFAAPSGTTLTGLWLKWNSPGGSCYPYYGGGCGWVYGIHAWNGGWTRMDFCQMIFNHCNGWWTHGNFYTPPAGTTDVRFQLDCQNGAGWCSVDQAWAGLWITGLQVRVNDPSQPSVSGTGLWTGVDDGKWKRGSHAITLNASDNTGISSNAIQVDDVNQTASSYGCNYTYAVPCSNHNLSHTLDTTKLTDGTHTIRLTSTDAASNTATTARKTLKVDNTAPQVAMAFTPGSRRPQLTWRASDTTSSINATSVGAEYLNGSTWTTMPSSYSAATEELTATVPAGIDSTSLPVRATVADAAGNTKTASNTVSVDSTAPTTSFGASESAGKPFNTPTPTFTFASDPGSSFQCRVDGGQWNACSTPWTTTPLTDGDHRVEVLATDAAGNQQTTPTGREFSIDTVRPTVSISGVAGLTNVARQSFDLSSSESVRFECSVDNEPFRLCESPTAWTFSDGAHRLAVRGVDAADNMSDERVQSFTVDTQAPPIQIGGPSGAINTTRPSMMLTSSDAQATFQCRIDAGSWSSCASDWRPELGEGEHTLAARAVDAAGNAGTASSVTVQVDVTRPAAPQLQTSAERTSDVTPTFTFAGEQGASFRCRVDGGSWVSCTSPWTAGPLAEGDHAIEVVTVDQAGNLSDPARANVTVDTTAPTITKLYGPAKRSSDTTPTAGFAAEDGARFECRLDDGPWVSCTSPWTAGSAERPVISGEHLMQVRATDGVGNVSDHASWKFLIDTGLSTGTDIHATIGDELILAVDDPAQMTVTHRLPGRSSAPVRVTSTSLQWSLSVQDLDGEHSGRMSGTAGVLNLPLQVGAADDEMQALTGQPALVSVGELVDQRTAHYQQSLTDDEDVFGDARYGLTALWSAAAL